MFIKKLQIKISGTGAEKETYLLPVFMEEKEK